ncbi:ATP-binding protein [Paenibacillus polymyxa]|uniref:ATP-binding protein n=1 Tax=Paenibacillus polymyxa TaxID=1406 RepID=UPI00157FCF86|nr:ATP-binding protein [Paenibacillus polymyxa]MBY0024571.1 ATP-binding protein [Paenibacillus polymyxa]MBY0058699.1 ATP-binding protein [Paenibacillus polymyxa]MBY0071285.1 ATP-binding protein [Paenibacillus polymyxa]MBY0078559.1 ATP-binding protein [Paenibacillus polymyxa]MBZ6441738.1 ATP-binding protein [Paenibacillus polymyxa]
MGILELFIDISDNNLERLVSDINEVEESIRDSSTCNIELIVSFAQYNFATPRVMTTVTAFLKDLKVEHNYVEVIIIPPSEDSVKNYMSRFNFFEINPYCSEMPTYPYNKYNGSGRFIELRQFDDRTKDKVNDELTKLIKVQLRGSDDFKLSLAYSVIELTDNTCCHAEYDNGGHICVQPYHGSNEVEVSIVDRGIGIVNSLQDSEDFMFSDKTEILQASVQENISSKLKDPSRDHQGFGLYALNEFIKRGNGCLEIYANGAHLRTESGKTTVTETNNWKGTLIYFKLPIGFNVTQWAEIMNRLFVDRGYTIPDHLLELEENIF